jgi:N-acetylmuramic acid 6-phosphate etherase
MQSTTEKESNYNNLDQMSIAELLTAINNEDQTVAVSVSKAFPQIEKLATVITERMKAGGRLFYIGAGTSGRLGVVTPQNVRRLLVFRLTWWLGSLPVAMVPYAKP